MYVNIGSVQIYEQSLNYIIPTYIEVNMRVNILVPTLDSLKYI